MIAVPLSDTWVLTGGPTAGSMPISNLQDYQPSNPTRFTDLTQCYFVGDAGAVVAINWVHLLYTDATTSATWRVRAATSIANLTAAPTKDTRVGGVDLTFLPDPSDLLAFNRPHGYPLWLGATPWSSRYWRVDVYDPTNPKTYFQAGRAYFASAYQASRGVKLGGNLSIDEVIPTTSAASSHQQVAGGEKFPSVRAKTGRLTFGVEYLPKSEALRTLYQIVRTRGATKDVFVALDPDDRAYFAEQSCYGSLKTGIKFQWSTLSAVTGQTLWTQDFECEELP